VRFERDFLLGVATSAHQIEGGIRTNDWWEWERVPGRVRNNHNTERACEHWTRYSEDIELLRRLGVNSYRLSVEWARIEPEEGRIDETALHSYRTIVEECRRAGIEPCVTLFHFTLPRWIAARGGWAQWEGIVPAFERFARVVGRALGPHVKLWVTLNEPMVYLFMSYLAAVWPASERGLGALIRGGRRMLRAHNAAARVLHPCGVAQHVRIFDPADHSSLLDKWSARILSRLFNWSFIDSIERGCFLPPFGVGESIPGGRVPQDYIGLNYYTRDHVRFRLGTPELFGTVFTPHDVPKTEMGWEIYPHGLYRLLKRAARFRRPIYILENGLSDGSDRLRPQFIESHLQVILRAISDGIPVNGYYYWSFMDNFEWQAGFDPRFGLYHVDYETQKRTLRDSGKYFADICRSRELIRWR
jgi:beta-glucosidase